MAPKKTDVSSRRLALTGRLVLFVLLLAGSPASGMRAAEAAGSAVTAAARPPSAAEAHERIEALRAEIAHHDELYFKQSAPVISDQAYDQLKRELAALEQAFPVLAREGVAPAGVGDDRAGAFSSYRHRVRMLSLSKSYTEAELRAFDARLMRQLGRRDLVYVVEPKFDGLAISVTYENGRLVRAVTRGNGTEGDDVTANVLTIRTLPRSLQVTAADGTANPIPALIELRGEIFISYPEFARLNAEREKAGELPYATPRNLASGSLKEHDPQEAARRRLEIVFYGRGACKPAAARPDSQQALLRQLHAWGLPTVEAPRVVRGADAMWRAVQALGRERAGFRFPTDGAVVKLDEVALQDKVGVNEQAPFWAMAFKFTAPFVETQLRAITWQIGRTGVLTPVAEIEPVQLGGATVGRATLYNRDEIVRRDIREGDIVYVEKAGEIIPAVTGVNLARRGAESKPYVFPADCPACGTGLLHLAGEAALRCPNHDCPAQVRRRLEYFASAGCVGITGLGPALVDKLVVRGWVKTPADLYRLRREDLLTLGDNVGRSTDRLLDAIAKSRRAELWRFIRGLGIPQVGETGARELARRFGSLPDLAQVRESDLLSAGGPLILGVGEAAAQAVIEFFQQPQSQSIVADLEALGVRPVAPARPVPTSHS